MKTGIYKSIEIKTFWIPAFAGMTKNSISQQSLVYKGRGFVFGLIQLHRYLIHRYIDRVLCAGQFVMDSLEILVITYVLDIYLNCETFDWK